MLDRPAVLEGLLRFRSNAMPFIIVAYLDETIEQSGKCKIYVLCRQYRHCDPTQNDQGSVNHVSFSVTFCLSRFLASVAHEGEIHYNFQGLALRQQFHSAESIEVVRGWRMGDNWKISIESLRSTTDLLLKKITSSFTTSRPLYTNRQLSVLSPPNLTNPVLRLMQTPASAKFLRTRLVSCSIEVDLESHLGQARARVYQLGVDCHGCQSNS
eukprot:284816454_6